MPDRIRENPRKIASIWSLGAWWGLFQLYVGIQYVDIFILTFVHVLAAISMTFTVNPVEFDHRGLTC